uniref:LysM and putative peptidoglycanbinding domaincontaining protein 4like [Haplochromis burtoni] n=1 Tax=Lepeophtheirus salmonis TaxID=72036 RepID=A0A0K2V5F7_LEPSM
MESYAIQIPVQPRDNNLRSISLLYNVSITELKRINRIGQETEFFALQFIKIPTQRNSALAERLLREVPGAQVVESSFSKMGWSFHYQEEWEGQGLGVGTTSPLESESEEGNSLDKSTKRYLMNQHSLPTLTSH